MSKKRTQLAVHEAPEQSDNPIVSIGKIPGEIREVPVSGGMTIRALFVAIGVGNLDRCEIQRNGREADLDDPVEAGDTILAIAKIRGN